MSDSPQPTVSIPGSPVVPKMVGESHVMQFSCHKGIACWNACCSNINISLTPYDIIRLKRHLGISSTQFLRDYTVPYEMEKDGIAGVKFKPVEGGTACRFMQDQGCAVYADRPTACRYYPLALLAMRKQDENTDTQSWAEVREDHCLGHAVERRLTIAEYRSEQGVAEYDELARGWRQLVLKKKSAGPAIGAPSLKSRQLFFMACYDVDRFREFVDSPAFASLFKLPTEEKQPLLADDVALMQFGFRFLRQVLFGEQSIELDPQAAEQRLQQWRQRQEAIEQEAAAQRAAYEQQMLDAESLDDEEQRPGA